MESAREVSTGEVHPVQGTPTSAARLGAGRVPLFCGTALAGRMAKTPAPDPWCVLVSGSG